MSFSKGFLLLREAEKSTLSSRSPMIDQAGRCSATKSAAKGISTRPLSRSSFELTAYEICFDGNVQLRAPLLQQRCHGEDTFGSLVDHSSMPQSPHSLSFRTLVLINSLVQLQHFNGALLHTLTTASFNSWFFFLIGIFHFP